MADNQLAVDLREETGKGSARKMRAAGRIPGICYGAGADPTWISLDPRELEKLMSASAAGINTLIDLAGPGGLDGKLVMIKDLQRDPIAGHLLHADLYTVDVEKSIQVSVPVHLAGSAQGVKMGGIQDQVLREVELSCLPRAIPEELRVDVTQLGVGDSIHVRDIALPEGVTLLTDAALSVVAIVAPAVAAAEEEEGEEAEAAAEVAEEAPAPEKAESSD